MRQLFNDFFAGERIYQIGGAHLHGGCTGHHHFDHVARAFHAAAAHNRHTAGLCDLVNHAHRDREHGRAGKAALCAYDQRRRARPTVPLEEAACAAAPAQEPLGLWELVQALPEEQRLAVTLYYYDGLSVGEIAQVLGAPQGTVKSRLSRGRDKLRERLREEGIYEL